VDHGGFRDTDLHAIQSPLVKSIRGDHQSVHIGRQKQEGKVARGAAAYFPLLSGFIIANYDLPADDNGSCLIGDIANESSRCLRMKTWRKWK
jgi:hypothetical protein